MSPQPLANQVALVTGAGRRIGRVIALTLAQAGADIVVNYCQSRAAAVSTTREIEDLGVSAAALRADVSKPRQVEAMFRMVEERFGRLDLLVNNAGVFFARTIDQLTEHDWDHILGVNLKGPFFCAQAAARLMRRQGGTSGQRGHIINISSLGGLQAWPTYMHYCCSKAALIMLTRCLAKALAPGIRVNSIAPGDIRFPGEKADAETLRRLEKTPLHSAGRPEDVASAVLYLATSAGFVTGQVIAVDGGKSIP